MTLSKSDRLRALIRKGHFPAELPPPFHTEDLARHRTSVSAAWGALPTPKNTQLELFSVPRIGARRRSLAVVNPVPQTKLAKLIADEWINIRSHLRKSKYAIKAVEIGQSGDRSVAIPDFNLVELRKYDILSQYDHVITSDTSRFYSTIYTHSIPWALHTKKWCKDHLPRVRLHIYNASLGAKLDSAVRHCQENQSIGIPIGPDTSRILSEIVASSVDQRIDKLTNLSSQQAYRNVDDWLIGYDASESGEKIISHLASSLDHFGLEIHPNKTKTEKSANVPSNLWPSEIRKFAINEINKPDRSNLVHFIEQCINLSHLYPHENVLNFAVKISSNFKISEDSWSLYESFLLRCCRSNATSIPVATKIFSNYSDRKYPINQQKIQKLIADTILRCAPFSYHFEVSWALFLAKTLKIEIRSEAAKLLGNMESSVCALLALDCQSQGLVPRGLNTNKWRRSLAADGLWSNLWLLSYEADLKGWLRPSQTQFVENDAFFSVIKSKNISFYDQTKTVNLVKTRKWPTKMAGIDEFLKLFTEEPFSGDYDDEPWLFDGVNNYGDF